MSQVSNNYQPNYGNAIGTAVVGGTLWGVGQYVFNKKPFIDRKENIKDSFVKDMETSLVAINDAETKEIVEFQKNLEKEIDAIKTKDELKEFVNNRKNEFSRLKEQEIKLVNEEISKMEIDNGKNFVKGLFESDGKYAKYYKDTLAACYNDNGKLAHDSTKMSTPKFEALKKVINKARKDTAIRTGAIFMVVSALMCCLFEFWNSRGAGK